MESKNFIFGTAGFAKEVDWLIQEIENYSNKGFTTDYFVAENDSSLIETSINNAKVISENQFESEFEGAIKNCFIAVGSPHLKKKIYDRFKSLSNINFPNLIHPSVNFDKREGKIILGIGNIICAKNIITTDVTFKNFVHMNLDCTLGHDSVIGSFTTISPGSHISGNVIIDELVFIGTGACILENIKIAEEVKIGSGAVLVKSALEKGTYVGIPAKRIV